MSQDQTTTGKVGRKEYQEQLEALQVELDDVARWLAHTGKRLVVLFEGRDAAGKGGAIAAIAGRLNPRTCHIVALPTAGGRERTQWYFQRYVAYLPSAGEMTLFDRSWYNRAGVERVMGFCTEDEAKSFLQQAKAFERMLVDDGILLLKYWLTVDQDEQEKRFEERLEDPLKRWKLSPIDLQARAKYEQYGIARDAMLDATDTKFAPWTLVDFGNQRRGRLALIRNLLDRIPDRKVPEITVDLPPLGHPPLVENLVGNRRRDVI
ncbi:MAG: polyphosphate kinase 2 [Planctomycetota bacterium]